MSKILLQFEARIVDGNLRGQVMGSTQPLRGLALRALFQVSLAIRRFAATELPAGWRVPTDSTPMGYARLPLPLCLEHLARFVGNAPLTDSLPDGPLGLAERLDRRVAFRFLPAFAQLSPRARAQLLLDWRLALYAQA